MSASQIQLVPPITISPKRRAVWEKFGGLCHWCGCETFLVHVNAWDKATIDHVIPRSHNGPDDASNTVLACNRCNNRRDYEFKMGLPEGAMIGKYKQGMSGAERKEMRRVALVLGRVALTADDKKAITAKLSGNPPPPAAAPPAAPQVKTSKNTESVLREQRDQALSALVAVRKELKHYEAVVKDQEEQLMTMTIRKLIRKRIVGWLEGLTQRLK